MQGQVEHMDTNSGMYVVAMRELKFSSDHFAESDMTEQLSLFLSDHFNLLSETGKKVIS